MAIAPRKFKTGAQVRGKLALPDESASKALTVNSSGEVTSSVTTDAELAYVSGVTSSIQGQFTTAAAASAAAQAAAVAAQADADQALLDAADAQADATQALSDAADALAAAEAAQDEVDAVELDVADLVTLSGVAANSTTLGSFSGAIIPDSSTVKAALQSLESSIESLPDPMEYKGLWDASTNSPALADGSGDNGDVYQVSVAGTQFTPSISFEVGDKAVYNGATGKYEKWDMTDAVISVNGQSGIVVLDTDDIPEGATNEYYTDAKVQALIDAEDFIKADGSIPFTADQSMGGFKLEDLATPTAPTDAVTKAYADALVAGAASPGDLSEGTFAAADSQAAAANVTGFAFANGVVRSFSALVSVAIDATTDLFEEFELNGVQRGADWAMSVESTGDESGFVFSITSAGQIQYQSATYAGFTSASVHFRAQTTSV